MSYTLADGFTLKNKLNAQDLETLEARSRSFVAVRVDEIRDGVLGGKNLDVRAIHKHLFQDVYEWAGRTRDERVKLSDGTTAFEPKLRKIDGKPFFEGDIQGALGKMESALKENDYLKGLTKPEFLDKAAACFAQLNHIHPFREGNGRTQRLFMEELAKQAGHDLDFSVISAARMDIVSQIEMEKGNLAPMRHMFRDISDPDRITALQDLQKMLESVQGNDSDGIPKWKNYYIATGEPGRDYKGVMGGMAKDNFFMRTDDNRVIVGKLADLKTPVQSKEAVTFRASLENQAEHQQVKNKPARPRARG